LIVHAQNSVIVYLKSGYEHHYLMKNKLEARHDAVEELVDNYQYVQKFQREFKRLFDLERYLVRIYKYSVESQSRAIYIDINIINRLNEFFI